MSRLYAVRSLYSLIKKSSYNLQAKIMEREGGHRAASKQQQQQQ